MRGRRSSFLIAALGLVATMAVGAAAPPTRPSDYRIPRFAPILRDIEALPDWASLDSLPRNAQVRARIDLDVRWSAAFITVNDGAPMVVMGDRRRGATSVLRVRDDRPGTDFAPRGALLGGFAPDPTDSVMILVAELFTDASGTAVQSQSTRLFLFSLDPRGKVSPAGAADLEVLDLAHAGPGSRWIWIRGDAQESQSDEPGVVRDGKTLLRDVDGDGRDDLVLWQRNYHSAHPPDKPGAFGLERGSDSLSVMLYQPKRRSFSEPFAMQGLPRPPMAMWDSLPSFHPSR